MHTTDIRELDRIAVESSVEIVAAVAPSDLDGPTPCAGWSLHDLLEHMTVQHHGFAAAARGGGGDPAVWEARPLDEPVQRYAEAAEDVLAAFAGADVPERTFTLAEMGPDAAFPAETAIGFHFIDYVVHAWDVARSLGRPFTLDGALAGPALEIAGSVPDGDFRRSPGSPFAPAVKVDGEGTALDRVVAMLGRDPRWTA